MEIQKHNYNTVGYNNASIKASDEAARQQFAHELAQQPYIADKQPTENKALYSNSTRYGKHPPIQAERIFDNAVYFGWNYGLQASASVIAAMWFKEGSGKPYFDKAADWMGKNVMSKITNKTGAEAAKSSHSWLTFLSLITVGNLFIPPIQYVENRKSHYVSKINDWLNARRTANGNAPTVEELKVQQDAIQAIAAEPVQTSASLWGGRAVGLAGNFLASYIVTQERDERMQNAFANGVSKGLETLGMSSLAKSESVKSFSRIALLDYGYSLISSNLIYVYSHYINPPKEKSETIDTTKPAQGLQKLAPAQPETPTTTIRHTSLQRMTPVNPQLFESYGAQHAVG